MLLLTRKAGQSIKLELDESLNPETPARELLRGGVIEVYVVHVDGARVELGIATQPPLKEHPN